MLWGVTPDRVLLALVSLLTLGKWLDELRSRRQATDAKIDAPASLTTQLADHEAAAARYRSDNDAVVHAIRQDVTTALAGIERIHELASKYHGDLNRRVGEFEVDIRMKLQSIKESDVQLMTGRLERNAVMLTECRDRTHDLAGFLNELVLVLQRMTVDKQILDRLHSFEFRRTPRSSRESSND